MNERGSLDRIPFRLHGPFHLLQPLCRCQEAEESKRVLAILSTSLAFRDT